MPDEDKNFGGSLVLDFRKWWRQVKTIYLKGKSNPGKDFQAYCEIDVGEEKTKRELHIPTGESPQAKHNQIHVSEAFFF